MASQDETPVFNDELPSREILQQAWDAGHEYLSNLQVANTAGTVTTRSQGPATVAHPLDASLTDLTEGGMAARLGAVLQATILAPARRTGSSAPSVNAPPIVPATATPAAATIEAIAPPAPATTLAALPAPDAVLDGPQTVTFRNEGTAALLSVFPPGLLETAGVHIVMLHGRQIQVSVYEQVLIRICSHYYGELPELSYAPTEVFQLLCYHTLAASGVSVSDAAAELASNWSMFDSADLNSLMMAIARLTVQYEVRQNGLEINDFDAPELCSDLINSLESTYPEATIVVGFIDYMIRNGVESVEPLPALLQDNSTLSRYLDGIARGSRPLMGCRLDMDVFPVVRDDTSPEAPGSAPPSVVVGQTVSTVSAQEQRPLMSVRTRNRAQQQAVDGTPSTIESIPRPSFETLFLPNPGLNFPLPIVSTTASVTVAARVAAAEDDLLRQADPGRTQILRSTAMFQEQLTIVGEMRSSIADLNTSMVRLVADQASSVAENQNLRNEVGRLTVQVSGLTTAITQMMTMISNLDLQTRQSINQTLLAPRPLASSGSSTGNLGPVTATDSPLTQGPAVDRGRLIATLSSITPQTDLAQLQSDLVRYLRQVGLTSLEGTATVANLRVPRFAHRMAERLRHA